MSEPIVETSTEIIIPEIQAFSPDVFDPRKEQLQEIADEVAKIEADPSKMDKDTLTLVNATKNKLVKARTTIEKTGKALRDPHTAYNKAVSAYENELIAIIEPQEKRLKEIEVNAKKIAIREERKLTLEEYKAKLASIGDDFAISDDELLEFDPNQRDAYYNQRLGAHLQAQKAEADAKADKEAEEKAAEQRKIDEEKAAIEREKENLATEKLNGRIQRLLILGFKDVGNSYMFEECTIAKDSLKTLDNDAFDNFMNGAIEYVENVKETAAAAAEAQKAADIKAAEEAATKKAQEEAAQKADAEEAQRQADEAAAKKAKEEQEAKETAELQARQSAEAFQKWQSDNSYNAETDTLIEDQDATGKVTILYREVSRYTHTS